MSERVFHCHACGLLDHARAVEPTGFVCRGCGELLTEGPLKKQVKEAMPRRKNSASASGKGEVRRRDSFVPGMRNDRDEARLANQALVGLLLLLLLAGLGFAGFRAYEAHQSEKRFKRAAESQEEEDGAFAGSELISEETEFGKGLYESSQKLLRSFYAEGLNAKRINAIHDSGAYAVEFENFYIRNSDKVRADDLEVREIWQSRLAKPERWLVRTGIDGVERDFVLVHDENMILIDWPHMVGLGLARWESFLKSERPLEQDFRVFAWLVNQGEEEVLLLRLAAPLFVGRPELAEASPIIRIPRQTKNGQRLSQIFEQLPEDENEIGFPRSRRVDEKMRQMWVRLRTEGIVNSQPVLELVEIKAGDWVNATADERLPRSTAASDEAAGAGGSLDEGLEIPDGTQQAPAEPGPESPPENPSQEDP